MAMVATAMVVVVVMVALTAEKAADARRHTVRLVFVPQQL
jgi:hypothetical protein